MQGTEYMLNKFTNYGSIIMQESLGMRNTILAHIL